jgi:hypothetical protein
MRNNRITVGVVLIIVLIISSCNSSSKKEQSELEIVESTKNLETVEKTKIKLTPYTKKELEAIFPKTLGSMARKEVSSYMWGKTLHAKALYVSSDNRPKSSRIEITDLSYLNKDKSEIRLYGQVNEGLFFDIEETTSDRFTRSKKINESPAVVEETSMEMFDEKYKDSKIETLLDSRLHMKIDGTRLTVENLEGLIGELNFELLKK